MPSFALAVVVALGAGSAATLAQQRGSAWGTQTHPNPNPPAVVPAEPPSPVGIWIDHTGRGAVEIQQCKRGLCGHIAWMKQPNDKRGQPLRDKLNGDRAKRQQIICGMQIMGDLVPMRDGSWDNGWIYDPEQGESFDVELRLRGPDELQVKGYKGFKFLSETFRWRRAATLPGPSCLNPGKA